nr:flavodoxin [uncultured Agathobaculum sp.]
MSKAAVIYWSQTGNTEQMATAIADGIRAGGAQCDLMNVADTSAADAAKYDKLALGCPAMGAEVLEESEFDPFFTELESKLAGRKVALFGSYDWGDGQWMRDWVQRANNANANVYNDEGLIINMTPDDDGIAKCKAFGEGFAAY